MATQSAEPVAQDRATQSADWQAWARSVDLQALIRTWNEGEEKRVLAALARTFNEHAGKGQAAMEFVLAGLEGCLWMRSLPAHFGEALPAAFKDIGKSILFGTASLVAGPVLSIFFGSQAGASAVAKGVAASLCAGVALPVMGTAAACKELCLGVATTPVAVAQSLGLKGGLCACGRKEATAPRVAFALTKLASRGDLQPVVAVALRLQAVGVVVKVFAPWMPVWDLAGTSRSLGVDAVAFATIGTLYNEIRAFAPSLFLYRFDLTGVAMVAEEQLGIPAVEYNMWPEPGPMEYRFVSASAQRDILSGHLGVQTLPDLTRERVFDRVTRGPFLLAFSPLVTGYTSFTPGETPQEGYQATGFWDFTEEQQEGFYRSKSVDFFGSAEGGELEAFLREGDPPVYIGWGSIGQFSGVSKGDLAALAVRALRLVGHRGVILGSYDNMCYDSLSARPDAEELQAYAKENVFWAQWLPHQWLLPRCRAAVHHGGASTTAASLRAGTPTVITPILFDQPFWAYHVRRLGVGHGTAELKTIDAEALADALRKCEEPEVKQRAAELGERLREEDGAGRAAQWILDFLREKDQLKPGGEAPSSDEAASKEAASKEAAQPGQPAAQGKALDARE